MLVKNRNFLDVVQGTVQINYGSDTRTSPAFEQRVRRFFRASAADRSAIATSVATDVAKSRHPGDEIFKLLCVAGQVRAVDRVALAADLLGLVKNDLPQILYFQKIDEIPSPDMRFAVFKALAREADSFACVVFHNTLHDGFARDETREAAVEALEFAREDFAIPFLKSVAECDGSDRVKRMAHDALGDHEED